jgi:hypothetical protein
MLAGTEVFDWMRSIELLSLDYVRPVYGSLGVRIELEETLRGLARDTLLGRLAGEPAPFQLDSWSDPADTYRVWITPLLSAIERGLGRQPLLRLEHWVKYIVNAEEDNPWVVYEEFLRHWASEAQAEKSDRLGLSGQHALEIEHELRLASEVDRERTLLRKQSSKPLSDWDFQHFVQMGLLEIPPDSDYWPLEGLTVMIIRRFRFQNFWRWLSVLLSPGEMDRLGAGVLEFATERNLCYSPPSKLPITL